MRFTLSAHAQERIKHRGIAPEWIEVVLDAPQRMARDSDDPELTAAYAALHELDGRVLCVVYNHQMKPPRIVTAYFVSRLRGKL